MKYKKPIEFIRDLIQNEGCIFADQYGREWSYYNFDFYFKDIGESVFKKGLECLHLHETKIIMLTSQLEKTLNEHRKEQNEL